MTYSPLAVILDRLKTGAQLAPPDAAAVLEYVGDLERTARSLDALLDALTGELVSRVSNVPVIAEVLNGMPTQYRDEAHATRVAFRLAEFILFDIEGSMHETRVALTLWNERAGAPLTWQRLDVIRAQAQVFGGPRQQAAAWRAAA